MMIPEFWNQANVLLHGCVNTLALSPGFILTTEYYGVCVLTLLTGILHCHSHIRGQNAPSSFIPLSKTSLKFVPLLCFPDSKCSFRGGNIFIK